MTLTDDQRQALIILEVGETSPAILAMNVGLWWSKYEDYEIIDPDLRDALVKRDAFLAVMGQLRMSSVDTVIYRDISRQLSQRIETLKEQIKQNEQRIMQLFAAAAGGIRLGQLQTIYPDYPLLISVPDANDPKYQGSPYVGTS